MYYAFSRLSRLDVKWADLFDAANPSFMEKHHNPFYELIVVSDGSVNMELGGSRVSLTAGDSLLLMPWEQHGGWNTRERQGKFFWAQFSCEPGISEFALDRAPELNIIHAGRTELRTAEIRHEDLIVIPRQFHFRKQFKLLGLFEELVHTMNLPKGYFRFHATILLAEALHLIAREFMVQSRLDTSFPVSYLTFRDLVNLLNNNYESDLSREVFERVLDRNYEYLCQIFKKYAGTNIHQYIHQLRIQRAKYLLNNTSKGVKEIAGEVGYQDPFYFSRMFKKIEGVAPLHYRELR